MFNRINNSYNLLNTLLQTSRYGMFGSNFPFSFYRSMAKVEQRNAELMAKVDSLYAEQSALERAEMEEAAYALSLSKQAKQEAAAAKKPKATLEDFIAINEKCRELNYEKLENAGNKIYSNWMWEPVGYVQLKTNMWIDFKSEEYALNSAYVSAGDRNAFDRQMVNRQIENIFQEHGIEVPEGEELTFTIRPYDYRIEVTGASDAALNERIEAALNQDKNGRFLYDHIYLCSKDYDNTQLNYTGQGKRWIYDWVKEWTGQDLRACTRVEDDFITPDGKSVKQMLHHYIDNDGWDHHAEEMKAHYTGLMLAYDYNDGNDQIFSIRYTDTGLHDIGQENGYGTGQTGWIVDMAQEQAERAGKQTFLAFV